MKVNVKIFDIIIFDTYTRLSQKYLNVNTKILIKKINSLKKKDFYENIK